ncbi:Gp15 family bacteriophage protein [Faecalicoccus acidiformans]|uniref:Gp15 family bacteriophage protein n=1 Tax=Faecalicoccus acidiformans TaxID=915173 RepID=UPI0025A40FB0|nr:Gp15 family bacteriophage protein [Faecalicoccus acidiformans]MDM8204266.1 Gp15 family bacteriophage protein [Faecalicoccus acidiformans]
MILSKKDLPTSIKVNGIDYQIKTDFRTWIKYELMSQDDDIPDQFRLILIIRLLGNGQLLYEDPKSVLDALFSFYRLDQPIRKSRKQSTDKAYSFDVDMPWIYAAFQEQYHIDLLSVDLHWWEFKSLFDSLSGETMFGKIQSYRTADLSKMSKTMQEEMGNLKSYWSLNSIREEKDPHEIEAELLQKNAR